MVSVDDVDSLIKSMNEPVESQDVVFVKKLPDWWFVDIITVLVFVVFGVVQLTKDKTFGWVWLGLGTILLWWIPKQYYKLGQIQAHKTQQQKEP